MYDQSDCRYNDDENIFEDANLQLFHRLKDKYYHFYFSNKNILKKFVSDGTCDCADYNGLCEDKNKNENYTKRTICFQTMCDFFQELYPIEIDKQGHTNETECEQWECDNIYTHRDGV
ncbi:unnamed protein product [Adineta steineri]|uniref:Uncharacterized protein n=1 Tax=Adineta steineri TaxID=433720 RepID=A0A816BQP0_9BILA|nr:unnamed protein product [Adineta steineri]CAF1612941.1 unnamed protein product [Adineta steineri]